MTPWWKLLIGLNCVVLLFLGMTVRDMRSRTVDTAQMERDYANFKIRDDAQVTENAFLAQMLTSQRQDLYFLKRRIDMLERLRGVK